MKQNKMIYDSSQIQLFVDRFFQDIEDVDALFILELFIRGTKSKDNTIKSRFVKREFALPDVKTNSCDFDCFIKKIELLSEYCTILKDDNGDPIPLSNLSIYTNVNYISSNKSLIYLLKFIADKLDAKMTYDRSREIMKTLQGKGYMNTISQECIVKRYLDYDIDLPDLSTKRSIYNRKLVKLFDGLFPNLGYSLISTNGGYHLIIDKSKKYFGNLVGQSLDFYKSILPDGNDRIINPILIEKLIPIYLGFNKDTKDDRNHIIYEFKQVNEVPLPGTLQKGYKVKFIK